MSHAPFLAGVSRRALLSALAVLTVLPETLQRAAAQTASGDPLPSWNDGATKQSIVSFVAAVTREGSSDFVPVPQRVATFDNDGTLWVEHPMYVQMAFALDRLKAMAPLHPEWKRPAALQGGAGRRHEGHGGGRRTRPRGSVNGGACRHDER